MRLNPHCLEAVHFTTEFSIFDPYLSLLCYHTCKLCIHWHLYRYYFVLARTKLIQVSMGLHIHKFNGMGELIMDQTGIQTSAH